MLLLCGEFMEELSAVVMWEKTQDSCVNAALSKVTCHRHFDLFFLSDVLSKITCTAICLCKNTIHTDSICLHPMVTLNLDIQILQ